MRNNNQDDNVFRFHQLRAAKVKAQPTAPGVTQVAAGTVTNLTSTRQTPAAPSASQTIGKSSQQPIAQPAPKPPSVTTLMSAQEELIALMATKDAINKPGRRFDKNRQAMAVTAAAANRLSTNTAGALRRIRVDLARQPVWDVLSKVNQAILAASSGENLSKPVPQSPTVAQAPYLRSVGITDLMVVKQQIKRYEATEVAYIENVLSGETRERTHRQLDRIEETFLFEREVSREEEADLEKTDRFEMNQETTKTLDHDRQVGFGLTVAAKYGTALEVTSNLQVQDNTSEQAQSTNAVDYAKDVVERSKERIVERTREQRNTRIVREVEEANLHAFANRGDEHKVGVYQFVDKIYETQVFNYGIRQIFDFIVPEPSAYAWYHEAISRPEIVMPPAPDALEDVASDASFINSGNYLGLAAKYSAEGVKPPPELAMIDRTTLNHGMEDDEGASETGEPRNVTKTELDIPAGYRPLWAFADIIALTDTNYANTPAFAISVGESSTIWTGDAETKQVVGDGYYLANSELLFFDIADAPSHVPDGAKLPIQVIGFESNNFSVNFKVIYVVSDATRRWQIATYEAIASAYRSRLAEYQQQLAAINAKADTVTEVPAQLEPPTLNQRIIRTELKKLCLAVVRHRWFEDFTATADTDPPTFDFNEAEAEGAVIRFLEQAFEWDQIQYVLYPYFWSRVSEWSKKYGRHHPDSAFREFLQAGRLGSWYRSGQDSSMRSRTFS